MRRGTRVGLAAALLCCAAAFAADGERPDVVAFTLTSIPVRAHGAAVHELDRMDRLAEAFGADLPGNPEKALAEVRRRLDSAAGRALRRDMAEATAGIALAARLGIEKLPAVVVDGRYAVYGVRDVRRALETVSAWRAQNEPSVASGPGKTRSSPHPRPGTPPARSLPGEPEA